MFKAFTFPEQTQFCVAVLMAGLFAASFHPATGETLVVDGDRRFLELTLGFYETWEPENFGTASYGFQSKLSNEGDEVGLKSKPFTRFATGTVNIANKQARIDYVVSSKPLVYGDLARDEDRKSVV